MVKYKKYTTSKYISISYLISKIILAKYLCMNTYILKIKKNNTRAIKVCVLFFMSIKYLFVERFAQKILAVVLCWKTTFVCVCVFKYLMNVFEYFKWRRMDVMNVTGKHRIGFFKAVASNFSQSLLNAQAVLGIAVGKLDLDTWKTVFYDQRCCSKWQHPLYRLWQIDQSKRVTFDRIQFSNIAVPEESQNYR